MASNTGTIIEDEEAFLDDVEAFMKIRGVPFDRDGKVAGRPVSLHRLYKKVLDLGGYDKISGERLKWRELLEPFGLKKEHEPAMTFQLKTVYYKNLAAYEMASYWGEDPPPPQLLEDQTAKGGDLRTRTFDNNPFSSKGASVDGRSDRFDEDDGQQTPNKGRMPDSPIVADQSAGRQLRQDPKRTQLFQPDPTPERPRFHRNTNSPQASPIPMQQSHGQPAATDPRNPNFSVDKYQPRQPNALTLRPVLTPASDREVFKQRKTMAQAHTLPRIEPDYLKYSLGSKLMQGPNIYNRCHFGIMSGIEEEQHFALHHLVKVSFERGDKFTFSGFSGMAEALLEKCLEITQLVFGVTFGISYTIPEGVAPLHTLNACFGTPNLLQQLQALKPLSENTSLESPETATRLERLHEAALVIRNMLTLETNAAFIAKFKLFRDFLLIGLNLPRQSRLDEFRRYVIDMADSTTRYWPMQPDDPLYLSLIDELTRDDRGTIISTLHAIYQIGVESDQNFALPNLSIATIRRLVSFLLLDNDSKLTEATLEVLYVFTAFPENIKRVLEKEPELLTGLASRLTTFLLFEARPEEIKVQKGPNLEIKRLDPTIPRLPQDLYRQLCAFPEPDRAARWLRCCFEESEHDDITQIAIWHAYSHQFSGVQHMQAAEFIKNISGTFANAQAQVIPGPQPRFIIKGIRPRRILVDTQGNGYYKCLWEHIRPGEPQPQYIVDNNGQRRHVCGVWHSSRQNLWLHIMIEHMGIPRTPDGRLSNVMTNKSASYMCRWVGCPKQSAITKPADLGVHVRGHIPADSNAMATLVNDLAILPTLLPGGMPQPAIRNSQKEDNTVTHISYDTATDDQTGQPCGIPFMAVMLMRNMARFVGKHGSTAKVSRPSIDGPLNEEALIAPELSTTITNTSDSSLAPNIALEARQDLMHKFFSATVRKELWNVIAVQRTLRNLLADLMTLITKGEKDDKKRLRSDDDDDNLADDQVGEATEVEAM